MSNLKAQNDRPPMEVPDLYADAQIQPSDVVLEASNMPPQSVDAGEAYVRGRLERLSETIAGIGQSAASACISSANFFRNKNLKKKLETGVVVAEINPFTNEGLRYGTFVALQLLTRSPELAATWIGLSTMAIEGGAVAAGTDLEMLTTSRTSNRLLNFANKKIEEQVPPDSKTPAIVKAGTAMVYGALAHTIVSQMEHPDRPIDVARRRGLLTATVLSGVLAVDAAVISHGADNLFTPKGAATVFAGVAGIETTRRLSNKYENHKYESELNRRVRSTMVGGEFAEDLIDRSVQFYSLYRERTDEAVEVGLYGEDLKEAIQNPGSVLLEYAGKTYKDRLAPLLVPVEDLKWYNMDLLRRTYGEDKHFYYFAHPPVPEDKGSMTIVRNALREKLDAGAVIITDHYADQNVVGEILGEGSEYGSESLGGGDVQRAAEVFVAPVKFEGVDKIKQSQPIYDVFKQGVSEGVFTDNEVNGTSVAETILGDEAEEIWRIYQNPFEELGEEHPMHAGFEKEELLEMLADPGVTKIVNRVDGSITTLCIFVQDFDRNPWFNRGFYRKNYPEYYRTNNILLFPGIVTDETKRGNDYALDVIDLATQLFARRGSNVLISFECTEISATYIPKIVTAAINNSGVAKVDEIEDPISTTHYTAFRRLAS